MISLGAGDPEAGMSFVTTPMPLAEVRSSVYPTKERLRAAWRNLSLVTAADSDTLYNIVLILLETVPTISRVAEPLPAEWGAAPVAARATHANPRAFKGTKYQPPKTRRLPQIDVRPHLCDARALKALVSPLWKFWDEVVARLGKLGYPDAVLAAIEDELRVGTPRKTPWSLPEQFVHSLWPAVRYRDSLVRSRFLTLFTKLDMGDNPRLLAAFARLIAVGGADLACEWGQVSLVLPAHRRAAFFEKLIETQAYTSPPRPDVARRVEETSALVADEKFPVWLEHLLRVEKRDVPADYLLAGFRLAAQFRHEHSFVNVGQCAGFPEEDVEEIGFLEDSDWLAMTLWERCGRLPGLAEIIGRSRWRSFAPVAARSYLRFLGNLAYWDMSERALRRKWSAIAKQIPTIEALIATTAAEYQEKVVECISDWLSWWDDPAAILKRLPRGCQILRRLAAAPFQAGEDADRPIMYFLELENEQDLQKFLGATDASFKSLETACRRVTDTALISRGLEPLTRLLRSFTVDAFLMEPKRLCRSAKMLGSVSAPIRAQILSECKAHLFFRIDPMGTPIGELCAGITANLGGRIENPIPARLSSWLRGEIELSKARLERYQRVLSEKFMLTRLSLIEESVVNWLKRGLPARRILEGDEHALRLLGTLRENRRGLRKFLNAYWAGDVDYLAKHPATLAWYRKHKTIARDSWDQGISFQRAHISIQVERDPFEVLKLGTYVGSCLAIGGMCSDSAVAALLDTNKRVLYARDHRKRVLARQLIAISDDDRLVCFSVYPLSASKEIKALFREYDFACAKELGVSVYEPTEGDSGYEISFVLSRYWWDDMSWNFEVSG
jgi:hypothetical protein